MIDLNKVLLYSTGNCIQYPVINRDGKEYEKKKMIVLTDDSAASGVVGRLGY